MAKIDEHNIGETVTVPKRDWDKMLSLLKQSSVLLNTATIGFMKLGRGLRENGKLTENDKSNSNRGSAGDTAATS